MERIKFTEKDLIKYKRSKNVNKGSLIFIGSANIANIGWCELSVYYKSRQNELNFMNVYFNDILKYYEKFMDKNIKNKKELFNTCLELTNEQIHILVEENRKRKELVIEEYDIDENLERGEIDHEDIAEKYGTMRWHIKVSDKIIIGEPDGIKGDFVYEFKSTKNLNRMCDVAILQASCYAEMFKRRNCRIHIYDYIKKENYIYESKPQWNLVEETIRKIKNIEEGKIPMILNEKKCNYCDYVDSCIYQKKRRQRI